MAKRTALLTDASISALGVGKRQRGGDGLFAENANGIRYLGWRYPSGGKYREHRIGRWRAERDLVGDGLTVRRARDQVYAWRGALARGNDPFVKATIHTFAAVARELIAAKIAPVSKRGQQGETWQHGFRDHARLLLEMDVAAIAVDDVLAVMNQPMNGGTFWLTMNPTASRLRGRIEAVLSYAKARGWRDGPNPALWRDGLEHVLAAPDEVHQTIRHRALDWRQAPAFVATLRQSPRIRARMAEFVMLTWTRSTPVLEMRWGQIDVERCIWIVPRENEKTGKPHRVPLCDRAMELVLAMRPADVEPDDVVFHSPVEYGGRKAVRGKNTMLHEVSDYTSVHGLRATVKQWSKATGQSRELTEEALSHLYEGKVEKAYSRDEDQLEQRRPLMQKWSEFLDSAEIIDLAMRRVA